MAGLSSQILTHPRLFWYASGQVPSFSPHKSWCPNFHNRCARQKQLPLQDEKSAFAQLTVRIRALHRFAAYSGKAELKAGIPGREFPVQDVWILERAFKQGPTSRWRIAGVLPPVTQKGMPSEMRACHCGLLHAPGLM